MLAVVLWFILEHTPVGRYLFAVGGNPDAARLAGLNVERLTYGSLMASATIAGLAGVIFSMKVGHVQLEHGPGLLFPALAAVFFGASQFTRRPNVWGTLVAYFALAFGVKGLQLAFGPGTFWIQPLFQGAALLIAVALASREVGETRRSRRLQREATLAAEAGPTPVSTTDPTSDFVSATGPSGADRRHQGAVPPSTFKQRAGDAGTRVGGQQHGHRRHLLDGVQPVDHRLLGVLALVLLVGHAQPFRRTSARRPSSAPSRSHRGRSRCT